MAWQKVNNRAHSMSRDRESSWNMTVKCLSTRHFLLIMQIVIWKKNIRRIILLNEIQVYPVSKCTEVTLEPNTQNDKHPSKNYIVWWEGWGCENKRYVRSTTTYILQDNWLLYISVWISRLYLPEMIPMQILLGSFFYPEKLFDACGELCCNYESKIALAVAF
jgi:hypothetical protein